jgi:glycerol-3-phosphate acyltransferase PlsY
MTTVAALRVIAALAIGLALGSILPADLLARLRGIDIRSVGDGNPGTWNAFAGLGLVSGLATLVYDGSVGIVSVLIARELGVSEAVAYLAGIMAVVGHRWPVFRGLRGGGQGMAASAGLIIYGAGLALSRGWLSAADFLVLLAIALVALGLTRSATMVGIAILPALVIELALKGPGWPFLAFMTAVAAHIWITQVIVVREEGGFEVLRPARGHPHR